MNRSTQILLAADCLLIVILCVDALFRGVASVFDDANADFAVILFCARAALETVSQNQCHLAECHFLCSTLAFNAQRQPQTHKKLSNQTHSDSFTSPQLKDSTTIYYLYNNIRKGW